ncbi:MAG: RNA-binding domain-containing protein [Clostridia bacterium]
MLAEGKGIELKREYVDDIKKTVIAFANCDGGNIYIGVNNDGTVCGIEDTDEIMLKVTNAIRDAIRPDVTMFVDCRAEQLDEKAVLCISVQRGTARPYYLQGKGIRPEGVFVRQGASTVPATESAILNMIKDTSGDSYEKARSINQELTFEKTTDFFKKRNIEFGNAQMRTLHFIGEDGMYTNLAFLLSDQCSHNVKLAVFEGSVKTVFKDRKELSGSLLSQLEEAYEYIERYNRTRAEFSGLDRIDSRDYPTEAVREALLNAIVHRDYAFSGPTLISIFDDRIEFVTIGGLVKGISLDDVFLGVSVLRNQNLANVFYRLNLIEAYGTGVLKINGSYADCNMKPVIEATDNAFKITLPNLNYNTDLKPRKTKATNKRETIILEYCKENNGITRHEIQELLDVSQATAILIIKEMIKNKMLIKVGQGRNVSYITNER